MRINNNAFQRNANISMVAQMIWRRPGISRIEIARELSLYRSTVTNIIQTLIEAGVVYEAEAGEGLPQGGRKPILLRVNERMGCVLGLELQPERFRAALVDVYGRTLNYGEGPLGGGDFPALFAEAADRMRPVVEGTRLPLLGICAGIPGVVDPGNGRVLVSEPFRLRDYPFRDQVARRYPVPVIIENDANCCAWEQLTLHRGEGLDDFLCVLAEYHAPEPGKGLPSGIGVGLGVALGGTLHYGKRFAAGEFASARWKEGRPGQFGLSDAQMAALPTDDAAFGAFAAELFESLTTAVAVLDPEAVFLHGDLCRRRDAVLKAFAANEALRAVMAKQDSRLEFSAGGEADVAHGAASMFLQKLFAIPELSEGRGALELDWDETFSLVKSGSR
jgi:predicted NBD/HSP70 family sugar kinase